jgi:hypothetical protein
MENEQQRPQAGTPVPPVQRESLGVTYEDSSQEVIIVKRLSNTNMVKWARLGCSDEFLVFASVEFGDNAKRADQAWFDSLEQESALAVVEAALRLNNAPAQKKIIGAIRANLESWLSLTKTLSSSPADGGSKS